MQKTSKYALIAAFAVLFTQCQTISTGNTVGQLPALSNPLRVRVAIARETALNRKDIKAVRALLRFAEAFRKEDTSVSEAEFTHELEKIERHLGIAASTPADHNTLACPAVFVPQRLYANISYADDTAYIDPQRTLDIYTPTGATKAPVLIWIHGGGLTGGDKAHPGLTLIKPDFFLSYGFVFVSVNYRLMPDHVYPTFMNDAARAVAWIHDNISDFGGDPGRINLIGHSAGAHIASLLATNQSFLENYGKETSIIKSVLSLDIASYDFARRLKQMGEERRSTLYVKAFGDDERTWIEASPARQIEPGEQLPAFLLLYAGDHHEAELMRKENEEFFKQLKHLGVTTALYEAPGRTHESLNLRIGFHDDPASREIIAFLSRIGMINRR